MNQLWVWWNSTVMVRLSSKRPRRLDRKNPRRRRSWFRCWLPALVCISFLFLWLTIVPWGLGRPTIPLVPQNVRLKVAQFRTILHETAFHETIQDCLPSRNKKCQTFVPESSGGEKMQRVALVVPPGKVASLVLRHMNLVANDYNSRTNRQGPRIQVFRTSHVPPYGYGKSHGLTRIVKLRPDPLLLQVTDALEASLEQGQSLDQTTWEDLEVTMLQIMRFHCRLSHVAAHTASLSIDVQALVNATKLEQVLRDFMTNELPPFESQLISGDAQARAVADEDAARVLSSVETVGTNLLTRLSKVQSHHGHTDVWTELDEVLRGEMQRTKDQSIWPCPSFWGPSTLSLSAVTRNLAMALSPNCQDPFVSCFVQKDKCEAVGDPVCKKKAR